MFQDSKILSLREYIKVTDRHFSSKATKKNKQKRENAFLKY